MLGAHHGRQFRRLKQRRSPIGTAAAPAGAGASRAETRRTSRAARTAAAASGTGAHRQHQRSAYRHDDQHVSLGPSRQLAKPDPPKKTARYREVRAVVFLSGRPSGRHHFAQFANAEIADLVHADQDGRADRQRVVTDFADHGRRNLQRTRQGRVVFQLQLFDDRVQDAVRIVGWGCGDFFDRHNV